MQIILVRHGQTIWNKDTHQDRYNGLTDVPLSKAGKKQIRDLGLYLKDWGITAFYSSPLQRSVETARAVMKHYPANRLQIRNELRELDYGDWEGLTLEEIRKKFPAQHGKWEKDPAGNPPTGGETGRQVCERVLLLLKKMESQHPGQTIFIAGHKNVNRILLCALLGLPLKKYRSLIPQRTGAINVIEINGGKAARIIRMDDLSYLIPSTS